MEEAVQAPPKAPHAETMTIADRVRTARIAANKTQQQLAGDTYSKSYISAVERGKMTPSVQALGVLAQRLGLPVSYFLGESEVDLSALADASVSLRSGPERDRLLKDDQMALLLGEAELLLRQHQPEAALERLQPGETKDEPPTDLGPTQRPRWYWLVGWALGMKHLPQEAIPLLERGLSLAETMRAQAPLGHKGQLAEMSERLRCWLGTCYYALNQGELAVEYHRRCLSAITDGIVGDPELKLRIYVALGNDYLLLGRSQEAIGYYEYARAHLADVENPLAGPQIYWGLTVAYKEAGDLLRARTNVQKALTAQELQENQVLGAQLRGIFGQILIHLGKYEEAEENLKQSLGAAQRTGDAYTRGSALANYADLHIARQEYDKAVQSAKEGLKVVAETKDERTAGELHLTLAAAYEAKKDGKAAEQAFKQAISTLERTDDRDALGKAHERYGKFLADQGRFQEAYDHMHLARSVTTTRRTQG